MLSEHPTSITRYFQHLSDYRYQNVRHPLINILTISLCALVCGADDWVEIELFGNTHATWLATFLDLSHGIPSHDTFGRVFRHLDSTQFGDCFVRWMQHVTAVVSGEVVAVDGKQLRGSKDGLLGLNGLYVVNAWASETGLALGQLAVERDSNEITVIPALLKLLDLAGAVVTADALNCQTAIAETIVAEHADYVLAVKGNQTTLYDDLVTVFSAHDNRQQADYHHTVNKNHGRVEIRQCWVLEDDTIMRYIQDYKQWQGLKSLICVESNRWVGADKSHETRYFISSLGADAVQALQVVRRHWGIENRLHWVLDMAFREDASRVRKDHAPHNLAIMRQVALNLLRRETSLKVGIKAKRKRAGWDNAYLLRILQQ